MNLMLTSFGVGQQLPSRVAQRTHGDFPGVGDNLILIRMRGGLSSPNESLSFYRMPPVDMRALDTTFLPDYAALLLCDKVIVDEASFALLAKKPHGAYARVAETFKSLHSEGFIELADFNRIVTDNQPLLERMLEYDLKILDQWVSPLKESTDAWNQFLRRAKGVLHGQDGLDLPGIMIPHLVLPLAQRITDNPFVTLLQGALESSRKRKRTLYRRALRETVADYLSYVNANIVISNELGTGFHDWADFLPFYQRKFLPVGREKMNAQREIEASRALFEVSFPELAVHDTKTLIKALRDKRIADLRELVQESVDGRVQFDQDFARRVLKEVLRVERKTNRYRKIISYLTIPLHFVPAIGALVQKASEEIADVALEHKLKKEYRWFYMLSDLSNEGD